MNVVDAALVLIIVLFAVRGIRRGVVLGVVDVCGLLLTLVVGLVGARGLGPLLARLPFVRAEIAPLAAFFVLVLLAAALYTLVSYSFLEALRPRQKRRRSAWAGWNRLFRVLPGLLVGGVVALLSALALQLLPLDDSIALPARESGVARSLRGAASRLGIASEGLLPLAPRPLLRVESPESKTTLDVRFPASLPLRVEEPAEQRMLELVNRERRRAGLGALAMDDRLRQVARAHSREMFRRSYFAHQSPGTGSPRDRLVRANIPFLAAGENLAYQPDIETAHRALMESPGHRANVLSPLYRRVGIGVIRGELYGLMISQEFTD